jgi:hypothetical protein
MRIPRWLMVLLLLICAGGSCSAFAIWLILPTRTAQQFAAASQMGNFDRANRLLTNAHWSVDRTSIQFLFEDDSLGSSGWGWGWISGNAKTRSIDMTVDSVCLSDLLSGIRRVRLRRVENVVLTNDICFEAGLGKVAAIVPPRTVP